MLHRDLGILHIRPENSWTARDYNAVLDLFETPDAPGADSGAEIAEQRADAAPFPAPADVEALFEREETEARRDDHGSVFDRAARKWVDCSPVTVAMQDLDAATERNLWDLT